VCRSLSVFDLGRIVAATRFDDLRTRWRGGSRLYGASGVHNGIALSVTSIVRRLNAVARTPAVRRTSRLRLHGHHSTPRRNGACVNSGAADR